MTFSALDSALLGPLFATDAMRAVFADEARVAAMLRRGGPGTRASRGRPGAGLPQRRHRSDPPERPRSAALGRRTAISGVPVIPFVKAVQGALPPELEPAFHKAPPPRTSPTPPWCCRSATPSTSSRPTSLRSSTVVGARPPAPRDAVRRAHLRPARRPRHLRLQGGDLGARHRRGGRPPARPARPGAHRLAGRPRRHARRPREKAEAVGDGFAAALGLHPDLAPWHARRARIAEAGSLARPADGALAKLATRRRPSRHHRGRGGGRALRPGPRRLLAMPHKRNPVSSTVIRRPSAAAKGTSLTLLDGMAAAHERPAGAWHAEWHALPTLFGLAQVPCAGGPRPRPGTGARSRADAPQTST